MASLREIAEVAGVSVATASRVLSGSSHPVSEETRERVHQAADASGFHPNMLARGLITKRSHTMAVIVHDISDPYFSEIVRGLEDTAHLHRYQLFISSSDRDPERELSYVRAFLSHRVDAIVFAGGGFTDDRYQRELDGLLTPFRDAQRGRAAVAARGRRAVPLPRQPRRRRGDDAPPARARPSRDRLHRRPTRVPAEPRAARGPPQRAARRRIEPDDALVTTGHFTENGGARAAAALLRRRPDLTALFAANDQMALGALRELKRRDLDVPGDVSLAGFDDIRMATHLHPSLTTVRVPMYELGREGFFLALRMLDGERPDTRRLPVDLQLRESTGPPPA